MDPVLSKNSRCPLQRTQRNSVHVAAVDGYIWIACFGVVCFA